jgi:hypothetical protein
MIMRSNKLGRAAAAAGLMVLLAPTVAAASWWDGGYDGRYGNGGRDHRDRGAAATTTTSRPADSPPQNCGAGDCYDTPPSTQGCGTGDCYDTPPPPPSCGQPSCGSGPPPPPPAPVAPIYGCENSDLVGTELALHKTTVPPEGTPVAPGDEILVDITWRVTDFDAPFLHKALDCVYINGVFVPGLSLGEHDTPNDGHFGISYVVPPDAPVGGTICDQGFVSGPNGWDDYFREVSNVVCFPICAPAPPPPPPVVETTTTTTAPEDETPQPYTESVRFEQSVPEETPPAPAVLPRVLPRTGSGPAAARLAAAGLGLATLIRRRNRRR